MLADLLGSVGVLVAALVIVSTGWTLVDPLVSLAIAVLIVASAWGVLRDSTAILMEQTPTRHRRGRGRPGDRRRCRA